MDLVDPTQHQQLHQKRQTLQTTGPLSSEEIYAGIDTFELKKIIFLLIIIFSKKNSIGNIKIILIKINVEKKNPNF
jgi:hypothetical protein